MTAADAKKFGSKATPTIAALKKLLTECVWEEEASTPFRTESDSTVAWRKMVVSAGAPFLKKVLGPTLDRCRTQKTPFTAEMADRASQDILNRIYASVDSLHVYIRESLRAVYFACASNNLKRDTAIRNLFFLRFVCAALVDPVTWQIAPSNFMQVSDPNCLLNLALISKRLGVLAQYTAKDPPDNPHKLPVQIFLQRVIDTTLGACNPLDARFATMTSPILETHSHANAFKTERGKRSSFFGSLAFFSQTPTGDNSLSPKLPEGTDLKALTADQVSELLFAYNLTDIIDLVRKHNVDGKTLAAMTDQDMQTIGIARPQHRKKLLQVIRLNQST